MEIVRTDRLARPFFARPTLEVARDLLGQLLVRIEADGPVGGVIRETEAYIGEEDLACHAKAGRTARTAVMYGAPGHAYVYFNYGMHWLFNIVTEPEGKPAAVLVRAIEPVFGLEKIQARRRGRPRAEWTNGPAKLCQALGIDKTQDGLDLCSPHSPLFIARQPSGTNWRVTQTPRVGLNNVPEPWKSRLWRFVLEYMNGSAQDKPPSH